MRSHARSLIGAVAIALLAAGVAGSTGEPKDSGKESTAIRESAYYEFRGHIYDRSTIDRSFTLYWGKGHQAVFVNSSTRIFRHGRVAQLQEVKSGDAVRGIGQVKNGRLTALIVAFGDDGVDFPPGVKVPESITLPPSSSG